MQPPPDISVVIPTYNRGVVLLDTIAQLLAQTRSPHEIIVVDQTQYKAANATAQKLETLHSEGSIVWLRRNQASIPKAMNAGLLHASAPRVLFIDDDVRISENFIELHRNVIENSNSLAHVGQIVQPWQRANTGDSPGADRSSISQQGNLPSSSLLTMNTDLDFAFNSNKAAYINNCMAGNLCVSRDAAVAAGGFDENFYGVAYRFETEFCKRFCQRHDTLFYYSPLPILNHLHIKSGGTRAHADVLRSSSAVHSMGDYYFALLRGTRFDAVAYVLRRLFGSIVAKFYVQKPWFIPARLLAEARGLIQAWKAYQSGQNLIQAQHLQSNNDLRGND